jgi:hypothetical protein
VPDPLEGKRWGGLGLAAAAKAAARAPRSARIRRGDGWIEWVRGVRSGAGGRGEPIGRAQRRARFLHRHRRRAQAGRGEQARRRGLELGRVPARPGEEGTRRRVAGHGAVRQRDHAIGGGEAALKAVLRQHDRRAPLLVEPAQHAEQLVPSDRVELGRRLVEEHETRPPGQRGAQRHALQLAAGQLVRRAVEQVGDPQRERGLLHPARHRRGLEAAVLQREGQLRPDRAHDDLGLRLLEQRAGHRRQVGRTVRAHVQAADLQPAGELAAVEVRHQAGRRLQQCGLP